MFSPHLITFNVFIVSSAISIFIIGIVRVIFSWIYNGKGKITMWGESLSMTIAVVKPLRIYTKFFQTIPENVKQVKF